ncbi:MAG: glycoside hydrolase family 20 zincin-like fold domain-containing protein [Prolixibacteraceae bacterium]
MRRFNKYLLLILTVLLFAFVNQKGKVTIVSEQLSPSEKYAIENLSTALTAQGYEVQLANKPVGGDTENQIIVGKLKEKLLASLVSKQPSLDTLGKEGFTIQNSGKTIRIGGADASGTLYGCLELADQLKSTGKLPKEINMTDRPGMVMRGTCIGLQKTTYLPGRTVYEYPYTPENFPWFYDKALWIKYLDMMVENRYNSLYLWNGHPFASLVKLKDYPYAVEVDDATFKKNEEMFTFLTEEAGKRGIWVIQMFYNIIVSKPFAEHNNMKTQDRSRPIIPIIADYTRKSIAAFIEKYPNVGLLITLGEAMNTIEDDMEWFSKTILPGVKDGLKALGRTDDPPVVLRGHDTDARRVMAVSLPIYKNLYTMFKYNGESLTTYEPRDSWETIHKELSSLGSVHISNVHILANLEPFRYGSPDFIQKCVQAMKTIQGAKGVHVYPQASYWDWPYSADKKEPRELEMDRDWIWYKNWGRYAWNSTRNRDAETEYWGKEIGNYYSCGKSGLEILKAYEQTGEIAPKLLRTFGISDGNRQSLLLGMFMSQLVNPNKYGVYSNFYASNGPLKEILEVYAQKEWKGESHSGETPPQVIEDVVKRGQLAVEAIEKAASAVKTNQEEFSRLKNDVYCYRAFANCFSEKVKAAMLILRYQNSKDLTDLEKATPFIEKSLEYYTELVRLTANTYLYANSMQTQQRRIPISGANGTNKTWTELLPHYQAELKNFKRNVNLLKSNHGKANANFTACEPAQVTILNKEIKRFGYKKGEIVYSDNQVVIEDLAPELKKLSGVVLSEKTQEKEGTLLRFKNDKPVKVLVGYFNTNSNSVLNPPTLETNAQANNRGQADIRIANALLIPGLYPINVYSYSFEAGENELQLGRGRVLVLGFMDGKQEIPTHDANVGIKGPPTPDWLFY